MALSLQYTTTTTTTTLSSSHPQLPWKHPRTASIALGSGRRHRGSNVSCKARNGGDEQTPPPSLKLERRDVLLGLGGASLYTLAGGSRPDAAFAEPVAPPDLSKCGPADLPANAAPTNCCPPYSQKIIDFKLPSSTTPMKVRQAAHLVDKDYIEKYKEAVRLMKSLPADDPRNFTQQANVHCAYCDGAYDQIGFPNLELQVHNSWLFLPWHRYYLYFHERILGKLIGDDSFALPFWNWDAAGGMHLPAIYADKASPLYNKLRDAKHQPPAVVDLDYAGADSTDTDQQVIASNLTIMYKQIVAGGKTALLFMGAPYRKGDEPNPGLGSLENIPHGPVHLWTGDRTQPTLEDMGNFYSAARDPIFYAHHSNCDRMWNVWKTIGGKRKDFTDPDWLDAAFLFYNENAELVRVKIRDCVDSSKLRYTYQNVDIPWLQAKPASIRARALVRPTPNREGAVTKFPVKLNKVLRVVVSRPKKGRSRAEKDDEEEVLVIDGVQLNRDVAVKFDVYINLEEGGKGPRANEFVGSFVNVPHKHGKKEKLKKTRVRLGITDALEDLGADDDDEVVVTLVPRQGKDEVSVGGLKIEFST
ncbi:hypothetical protein ACLOJK_015662 [Asimina triloba]